MNELERLRETNDFLLNDAKYKMQKILELESELKECKELNRVLHPII